MKISFLFLILIFPCLVQAFTFEMGSFALQGDRDEMEDQHVMGKDKGITYAAVYDGHGGDQVSLFLKEGFRMRDLIIPPLHEMIVNKISKSNEIENILHESYQEFDKNLIRYREEINPFFESGSTAVTAFIKNKHLYVANLGDAEAYVIKTEGSILSTENMTKAHKITDKSERARIKKFDGNLIEDRIYDNSGIGINVARAFGDPSFKSPHSLISNEPNITQLKLKKKYKYIVLACDGLWDVMTSQMVARFILKRDELGISPNQIAKALAYKAYNLESDDNISVIVIKIIDSKK